MVVVDASILLEWLLPSERTHEMDELIVEARLSGAWAPPLLQLEVANGLRTKLRQGRISAQYRNRALARLHRLGIEADVEAYGADRLERIVDLSDRFGLSVYDATYLELAVRLEATLASLDKELVGAARAAGLQVMPD